MNEGAQIIHMQPVRWLHILRDVTNSMNERTMVSDATPTAGIGHTASLLEYEHAQAIASTLVLANLNSLVFDWATRLSVGGLHMSFFIVKQLPVLPPEAYLEEMLPGLTYAEAIVPRALELTYTSWELQPFAEDLGYEGAPFRWDDARRHRLRCELDAVFAHMYRLDRADLEWILDAEEPSESFPTLKNNELKEFGEYRTQRYALDAYDRIARGELPDIPPDIPNSE